MSKDKQIVDKSYSFPSGPKAKFSCPVSPYVSWSHNLIFKECPLCPNERDYGTCSGCPLKGEPEYKNKAKKNIPSVEKKAKEPLPKIGKTYSTEE